MTDLATKVVRAAAPRPDNFWSFVSSTLIIFFILYITKVGSLKAWVNILLYAPASATQVASDAAAAANSAKGGGANAQEPVNVGGLNAITGGLLGSPGTQIVPPGTTVFGQTFGNIMKFFGGGK
jgi:hypothetical protein